MRKTIRFNDKEEADLIYLMKLTGLKKESEVIHFAVNIAINYIKQCHKIVGEGNFSLYFIRDKNLTKGKTP